MFMDLLLFTEPDTITIPGMELIIIQDPGHGDSISATILSSDGVLDGDIATGWFNYRLWLWIWIWRIWLRGCGWWGPSFYHPACWGGWHGGARPYGFYGNYFYVHNNIQVNYANNIYRNRGGVATRQSYYRAGGIATRTTNYNRPLNQPGAVEVLIIRGPMVGRIKASKRKL